MVGVTVRPVENKRMLKQFIRLPWSLYRTDPAWVPPLLIERRQFLSPRNPYFAHAKMQCWLAFRGPSPVGRISAQIDRLHQERYQDDTGFFGLLEAQDEPDAFEALMQTAEDWLHARGMRRVQGPFNLSINHECGLLVEGFDTPPVVMMGHARPYYAEKIEKLGYGKDKDLLAYVVPADFAFTAAMNAVIRRFADKIRVRFLDPARFEQDVAILKDIFEDAWRNNWGFLPFTTEEFAHLGRDLKQLVPREFVAIAEIDGQPAAMMVAFPNINEIIRDLNGRLLPLGWLKLIWRLKVRSPQSARVPLMGVRRRYHGTRIGAAMALRLIDAIRTAGVKKGYKQVEMSWILEDNVGMCNMIEGIGGWVYKRYRIYGKPLAISLSQSPRSADG